jgi:hypothetical protein
LASEGVDNASVAAKTDPMGRRAAFVELVRRAMQLKQ